MLKIRLVRNKRELQSVFRIREIVFIKGQNVPRDREMDEHEKDSKHVIVFYNGKPVGCARVRFLGKKAKLERIAILKRFRGKGFGNDIMDYLVSYSKRRVAKEAVVHSQYYIRDFYRRFGFKERGKTFMDAGIKHIEMFLKL